jgi:hypothetical protein
MRAIVFVVVLAVAAVAVSGMGSASAHGVSPARLTNAGWTCFNVPDLGVHCASPGNEASSASMSLLVFEDTSDPTDNHAALTSTEILLRADLYHGQPCPQEGVDEYHSLDLDGDGEVDHFACHHS